MPVTHSPLRYPGGKSQLAGFVADIVRTSDLRCGVYCEPFAGGAGIAWKLLFDGDMSEVWLNDISPPIYAFWSTVVQTPDALCERIERTGITIQEWHRQRAVFADACASEHDLAFATLFLNRTNRSGILKGGVIGGKNQAGNYKLDCRFNKAELIHKIQRIHIYRDMIRISRMDAKQCLQVWDAQLPPRSLINIDPPYYGKGRDLYLDFYEHDDHNDLASVVRQLRHPWMLTYDDVPAIESLYRGLPTYRNSLVYYAQQKRRASELLVVKPSLKNALPGRRLAAA